MEELQARHRKEQKDLQGRITQKKKNATKKTRKGVNDECERLERDLKDRQLKEVADFDHPNGTVLEKDLDVLRIDDTTAVVDDEQAGHSDGSEEPAKKVSFSSPLKQEEQSQSEQSQRLKKNRQRERLARKAAERETAAAAAAEEANNQPDLRKQEIASMDEAKKKLGLTETFVRPDGHCLFSACAKGLPSDAVRKSGPFSEDYQNVRYVAADFMSKHRDDFEAFLEEPFDSYVKKIKDTAEWGGQLELQAISKSYNVTINVLQADGRVEKFEPGDGGSQEANLWLAYYRHSFGLGEHYNALSKTSGAA